MIQQEVNLTYARDVKIVVKKDQQGCPLVTVEVGKEEVLLITGIYQVSIRNDITKDNFLSTEGHSDGPIRPPSPKNDPLDF